MPQSTDEILNKIFTREGLGGSGGFKPHVIDRALSDMRTQQLDRMQMELLRTDPRSQHMSAMLGLTGRGEQQIAGAIINSRHLSGAFGGSRLAMFADTQTGLSNAGLLRSNAGVASLGYNGMTMDLSKQVMESMEGNFFSKGTGAADKGLTRGFSRDDISGVFARLSANGALRDMGQVLNVDEDTKAVSIAEDAKGKINDMMETSMRTMETFKDFMGDVGVDELMRGVAAALGKAAGSENDMREAMRRANELKRHAEAAGGSLDTWFGVYRTIAEDLASSGFGGEGGATAAMGLTRAMANAKAFAKPGQEGAIAATYRDDYAAFNQESPEVAALIYASERAGFDPEAKAQIDAKLAEAATAPDYEARNALIAEAIGISRANGGMDLSDVMAITEGDPLSKLSREGQALFTNTAVDSSQALRKEMATKALRAMLGESAAGNEDIRTVMEARATMDADAYGKFKDGATATQKNVIKELEHLEKYNPRIGMLTSTGETARQEEAAKAQAMARLKSGMNGISDSGGFLKGLADGLLGTANPDNAAIGAYLLQTDAGALTEVTREQLAGMTSEQISNLQADQGAFEAGGKVYKVNDTKKARKAFMVARTNEMRAQLKMEALPAGLDTMSGENVREINAVLDAKLAGIGADALSAWYGTDEAKRAALMEDPKNAKKKEQFVTLELMDKMGGSADAALIKRLGDEESRLTEDGKYEKNKDKIKTLQEQREALEARRRTEAGSGKQKTPDDFFALLTRILTALQDLPKPSGKS